MHIDNDDDDLKEYDLENYDEGGDGENTEIADAAQPMGMFGNAESLTYHTSNDDDPYITLKGNPEDDEDREDLQILATDNLLLAAKVEDDLAQLEVYVYEDDATSEEEREAKEEAEKGVTKDESKGGCTSVREKLMKSCRERDSMGWK